MPIEQTEPGTDLCAMERQYISITPVSLDLTDLGELDRLREGLPLDEPPPADEAAEAVEEDD